MGNSVEVECKMCGRHFVAKRASARFCSQNCRKAYSRRAERVERHIADMRAALTNLERDLTRWPDLRETADFLLCDEKIVNAVTGALVSRVRTIDGFHYAKGLIAPVLAAAAEFQRDLDNVKGINDEKSE